MVAESALNTNTNVADPLAATVPVAERKRSYAVDPLTAVVPVKTRTGTAASLSTCSVATEVSPESRDVDVVDTRGGDGARDGAADDIDIVPKHAAAEDFRSSSLSLPLQTSCGDHIDAMVQCFYSSLELGTEAMVSSYACSSSANANGDVQSSLPGAEPLPTTRDIFAASASETTCLSKSVAEPDPPEIEKRKNQDKNGTPKIEVKTDADTTKQQQQQTDQTKDIEDVNDASIETEVAAIKNQDLDTITKTQSGCCFMSLFSCSGGVQVDGDQEDVAQKDCHQGEVELKKTSGEDEAPILSLDEIIGDTLNITSSKVHILDTFSDDNTNSSANPPVDFVSPRAKYLLEEIEQIESQLVEVRKTASDDKIDEIKKRQDPFIEQMATIKQHLLDQQELLQSAPEDAKKDYYRAISHAAMLNAEVETRRAELELKKIRLESMKVEEEMDLMMGLGDSLDDTHTCSDSLDLTVSTKESGDMGAFDVFARFTASKFLRKRGRGKKEENL